MKKSIFRIYTEYGVSIDQRIRDARTILHDNVLDAIEYARQTRSVYGPEKNIVAWGVPK